MFFAAIAQFYRSAKSGIDSYQNVQIMVVMSCMIYSNKVLIFALLIVPMNK